MANEEMSLPYFIVILVVSALILRYLFFSGPSPATRQSVRSPEALMRSREAAVERIQQMFPQTDRRSVLWDLQQSGGSIQATTERILAGRLATPPVSFQPPPLPQRPSNGGSAGTSAAGKSAKPEQPDLITRYNLGGQLDAETSVDGKNGKGWSSNRDERQSLLHKRRDEMILAARRKMEAKIAAEKAAGTAA